VKATVAMLGDGACTHLRKLAKATARRIKLLLASCSSLCTWTCISKDGCTHCMICSSCLANLEFAGPRASGRLGESHSQTITPHLSTGHMAFRPQGANMMQRCTEHHDHLPRRSGFVLAEAHGPWWFKIQVNSAGCERCAHARPSSVHFHWIFSCQRRNSILHHAGLR